MRRQRGVLSQISWDSLTQSTSTAYGGKESQVGRHMLALIHLIRLRGMDVPLVEPKYQNSSSYF